MLTTAHGIAAETVATRPAIYVDRLIDESEPRDDAPMPPPDLSPGRRSWVGVLRSDWRDNGSRRSSVHGAEFLYSHETRDYGTWILDIAASGDRRGRATLRSQGLALAPSLALDGELGLVRAAPELLTLSSYRLVLPTSLLYGITGLLMADRWRLSLAVGTPVQSEFDAVTTARSRAGNVITGHYTRQVNGGLELGAQWAAARNVNDVQDHATVAVAARHGENATGALLVQGIVDDRANVGAAVDWQRSTPTWAGRIGGYRMDPGLKWAEVSIPNDVQGLYARADGRQRAMSWAASVEWQETNVQREAGVPTLRLATAFVSYKLQVDRRLALASSAAVTRSTANGLSAPDYDVAVNVNYRGDFGESRAETRGGKRDRASAFATTLGHQFISRRGTALSFALTHERERARGGLRRSSASVGWRAAPFDDWTFDISAARVRSTRGASESTDVGTNLNASVSRQLGAHWLLQAELAVNQIDVRVRDPLVPLEPFVRDQRLQLSLRYGQSRGTPYAVLSASPSGVGSGTISGLVFFDANGDGAYQASERVAPDVLVMLDGRYAQTTDSRGRFEFAGVAVGARQLSVRADRLPLPWSAPEGTALVVQVPLRGIAQANIALTKLGQ